MLYEGSTPQKELNIDRIRFIQSYDYSQDFPTEKRTGDFWELFYVKKGCLNAVTDSGIHPLSKTSLLLRRPDKSVEIKQDSTAPASLIIIAFDCTCTALDAFCNKPIPIGPSEHRLLHNLMLEIQDDTSAAFASEQLMLLYLQLLLIFIVRSEYSELTLTATPLSKRLQNEEELFQSVVIYMEEHICSRLTIDQICHDNLIGRGLLQKLFSDYAGCGIIDYFSLMKINTAKKLIRENHMNFSQIAEHLGYNSIHYFSRHFKNLTGLTPSEYAANVRTS